VDSKHAVIYVDAKPARVKAGQRLRGHVIVWAAAVSTVSAAETLAGRDLIYGCTRDGRRVVRSISEIAAVIEARAEAAANPRCWGASTCSTIPTATDGVMFHKRAGRYGGIRVNTESACKTPRLSDQRDRSKRLECPLMAQSG
jgi:hypothetical protein